MAFKSSLSRERSRRRRRVVWRGALALAAAVIFVAIGYSSYQAGLLLAERAVTERDGEIARLSAQLDRLRTETGQLRSDLAQSRQAGDTLRRRYQADVPNGGLAELVDLVRKRLQDGLAADRVAQVLRDASATRTCDGRVTRRRFPIQVTGHEDEGVAVLDGLIHVTAAAPGGPGDTAKATVVTINQAGAPAPISVTGLPVRQTITFGNFEMLMAIEPSELKGFVTLSFATCDKR